MREKDVFSNAFLFQPPLASRLVESFRQARRDFSDDPRQFITSAIRGEGIGGHLRVDRLRFGLALALATYMIALGLSLIFSTIAKPPKGPVKGFPINGILIGPGPRPDHSLAGSSDRDAGGGGGGGRGELTPPAVGQPPPFLLSEPILAPTTRPRIEPPSLPIPEALLGLPEPRAEAATGVPAGTTGPPSDGPGLNGGVGTGNDGGVGSGRGPGAGPGQDGGKDGGTYGTGRPRHLVDAPALRSRPVPLNHPRPNYTEEARKQRVQGVVQAKVLVGSDGIVKSVRIITGLPDGLDEEAIRAAYEMRFKAAVSNGRPIEMWVTLEIEFNLR